MSVFDTLTSIPSEITSGTTVVWAETQSLYPQPDYTIAYKFQALDTPVDGYESFAIASSGSGSAWTFTIASTTAPKPGRYTWQQIVTRVSPAAVAVLATGCMTVKQNLATAPTTTAAETRVATLTTAIATLCASTNQSVSFNGQSFTKQNLQQYRNELVAAQAEVRGEKAALAAINGKPASGAVTTIFE